MLLQRLAALNLPPLLPRQQMLDMLQSEVYGRMPEPPEALAFTEEPQPWLNFAGKANLTRVTANCTVKGRRFSFPFWVAVPTAAGKHPFFVHINFRPELSDYYQPVEEIIDNGFAVLSFCYNDVTQDNSDFTDGLAGILFGGESRKKNDPGKIALWAWAAQRVMDYAQSRTDLDLNCAAVCGHSRLGKTALLAAATDERFTFACSNESGCSGAAITRGKQGEHISHICSNFAYWFCENYRRYVDHEDTMPFDQHYLVAAIAPRKVCIGSAAEDLWADPLAEQLCCFAASPAFTKGFDCPDRPAEPGDAFLDGDIGYHLRSGQHFFSRSDWQRLMAFVRIHRI